MIEVKFPFAISERSMFAAERLVKSAQVQMSTSLNIRRSVNFTRRTPSSAMAGALVHLTQTV
jgi:hypothetical protein